ncbi:hypothetical protein BGZ76_002144 [Entomortierella beljakovae]|nr:hypothetical protein BGZ76_002144 [Entomortierella beljakovae]
MSDTKTLTLNVKPLPHRLFLIPEVVACILSHLSITTLRFKTSLVCQEWRTLSYQCMGKPLITANWSDVIHYTKNDMAKFKKNIVNCTCLHLLYNQRSIQPRFLDTSKDMNVAWEYFMDMLTQSQVHGNNKHNTDIDIKISHEITQLVIEGEISMKSRIESLLKNVAHLTWSLTAIRIGNPRHKSIVYLDSILGTCLNLIDLYLECPKQKQDGEEELGHDLLTIGLREGTEYWRSQKGPFKLQQLVLKHIGLNERILEVLFPRIPNLKSLEIIDAVGSEFTPDETISQAPISTTSIYTTIGLYLLRLRHVHVSFVAVTMDTMDSQIFKQSFENIKSWSLNSCDLNANKFNVLPLRIASPSEPMLPMLTTLEIEYGIDILSCNEFHNFLVSPGAASLIHLKASKICYSYDYLNPRLKKIWACRRLETLQLNIHDVWSWNSEAATRTIFGYFSQLFPRIKTLRLHINCMTFRFEGGLCLVRRMKKLESLYITSNVRAIFEEDDLLWLIRNPNPAQKLRKLLPFVSKLRRRLKSFPPPPGTTFEIVPVEAIDGIVPNLAKIGSLEDAIGCMEGLLTPGRPQAEAQGDLSCLESMTIGYTGSKSPVGMNDIKLIQVGKSFRPECTFRYIR